MHVWLLGAHHQSVGRLRFIYTSRSAAVQAGQEASKAARWIDRFHRPGRGMRGRGTTRTETETGADGSEAAGRVDADRWGGGCARKARMDCGQSLGAEILGCLDLLPVMPGPFPRLAAPPARPRCLSPTVTATTSTSHQQRPPAAPPPPLVVVVVTSIDRAREAPVSRPACTRLCLASRAAPRPGPHHCWQREGEGQAAERRRRASGNAVWDGVGVE
jgi:hypothetical protein